ncbi:MAG: hypothetical protein ABI224_10970 [Acetobacteraceae bacterium]
MSEPTDLPPSAPSLWATHVLIPTLWTPEQALAVFELLDDLREKIWTLYGGQIQAMLKDEQQHGDAGARGEDVSCDDHSF